MPEHIGMVIKAQPLDRMFTQTLLAAEALALLPYYTSGAVLCSWILPAELSLLPVTNSVCITSATVNSFPKQYCKSHSSNWAFCTSAPLFWGVSHCLRSWAEFQILWCDTALKGLERSCSSLAEDLALCVDVNKCLDCSFVWMGFNIRKPDFFI